MKQRHESPTGSKNPFSLGLNVYELEDTPLIYAMPKLPARTIGELRDLIAEWVMWMGNDVLILSTCGTQGVQVEAVYVDEHGLTVGTRRGYWTPRKTDREALRLHHGEQVEAVENALEERRQREGREFARARTECASTEAFLRTRSRLLD